MTTSNSSLTHPRYWPEGPNHIELVHAQSGERLTVSYQESTKVLYAMRRAGFKGHLFFNGKRCPQ